MPYSRCDDAANTPWFGNAAAGSNSNRTMWPRAESRYRGRRIQAPGGFTVAVHGVDVRPATARDPQIMVRGIPRVAVREQGMLASERRLREQRDHHLHPGLDGGWGDHLERSAQFVVGVGRGSLVAEAADVVNNRGRAVRQVLPTVSRQQRHEGRLRRRTRGQVAVEDSALVRPLRGLAHVPDAVWFVHQRRDLGGRRGLQVEARRERRDVRVTASLRGERSATQSGYESKSE